MIQAWTVQRGSTGRTLYVDRDTQRAWIREGTAAWRNNNPGCILHDNWLRDSASRGHQPVGKDCNGNAIFPDLQAGYAAMLALLTHGRERDPAGGGRRLRYNRPGVTLSQAIAT